MRNMARGFQAFQSQFQDVSAYISLLSSNAERKQVYTIMINYGLQYLLVWSDFEAHARDGQSQ